LTVFKNQKGFFEIPHTDSCQERFKFGGFSNFLFVFWLREILPDHHGFDNFTCLRITKPFQKSKLNISDL
jgi:hypothetical protein